MNVILPPPDLFDLEGVAGNAQRLVFDPSVTRTHDLTRPSVGQPIPP
jgi:hypothetical protein